MLDSDCIQFASLLSVQQYALCIVGHVSYMSASCCIMASIIYNMWAVPTQADLLLQ